MFRRLGSVTLFVAAVVFAPGCTPEPLPSKVLLLGDSITVEPWSWWSYVSCTTVANRSTAGVGVVSPTQIGGSPIVDRLPELVGSAPGVSTVVVAAGYNDLPRLDPGMVHGEMDRVEVGLAALGVTRVVWATVIPFSVRQKQFLGLTAPDAERVRLVWNREVVARGGVDVAAPLGDVLDGGEVAADQVHPSVGAHRVMGLGVAEVWCP